MQKLTLNHFFKGLNTDHDKNIIEPQYYTDAHNVELVSEGTFLALKNIKGTLEKEEITSVADTEVLKCIDNLYKIGNTNGVKCVTVFTAKNSGNFKIWCYDTENDALYELYEIAVGASYLSNDRIVDAETYSENGIDIVYFTDYFSEIGQLRCEIPDPYAANFLTDYDISLQRRGANGTIEITDILAGGTLLSGTYQYAYRMVNPDTKKYTKWSTLTNPAHVYATEGAQSIKYAGIGLPTTKKVEITITPTDDEMNNFSQYQIAVVENVYPTGAESVTNGTNQSFVASLLDVEEILSAPATFYHLSNTKVGTVPIEELVVDLAPVETAKTLSIKQNKLFLGNVKYRDLEYDNGIPTATGFIQTSVADFLYDNELNSTKYRGYFRNEVYRFGIVYYDKYGNYSAPSVLDLEGITDNQISAGIPDVKFPDRSLSSSWSILDASDRQRILGLWLTIDNHPTWAVGFEIVRVKRIKRVMFQTPVIPMTTIEGLGAFNLYPNTPYVGEPDGSNKDFPDAIPMTSSEVYVTKNLFWPENRRIYRRTDGYTGSGAGARRKGEHRLAQQGTYSFAAIFPQQDLYEKSAYNFIGNEKVETVDYCLLKLDHEEFDESTINAYSYAGNQINTKVTGTFYATSHDQYYYQGSGSFAGKSVDAVNAVVDYIAIPAGSEGTTLGGEKILTHGDLQTQGISGLSYQPTNQALSVIKLRDSFNDEGSVSRTFAAGTHNAYGAGGGYITGSSGPKFQVVGSEATGGNYSNKYIFKYTAAAEGGDTYAAGYYVQSVRIANIVRDEIGDTRYGDADTKHEFILTGTRYAFSAAELADVANAVSTPISVEVWGGDCFVNRHVFKVCDGAYSIQDQYKNNNGSTEPDAVLGNNWNGFRWNFESSTSNSIMIALGLEKVSQFIEVYLESEYNGVLDRDVLVPTSAASAVLELNKKSDLKSPLTYNYNINLSKQNDEKIFVPKPNYFVEQNDFSARVLISDQKIYNSDTQGFDVFRVLNFFDLQESNGALTALRTVADRLYAVQERSILDLPVGQSQIEQTDGGTLSVGTGSDIGRPIVIDSNRGGQHLAGIVESGGILYVPDVRNKAVYQVGGQELRIISSLNNETLFRDLFNASIVERNLIGVYDPIRKQYWLADNSQHKCYVFNEANNIWTGNFEFSANAKLLGGTSVNQKLYLLGKTGDSIKIYEMYTGAYNQLFGETVTPRVSFVVNPDIIYSKTFDNQVIYASDRLDTIDYEVVRESALGSQTGTIIVDNLSIEGSFRVKTMRDSDDARFRGLHLITTINWKTDDTGVNLSSVLTKYKPSSRAI